VSSQAKLTIVRTGGVCVPQGFRSAGVVAGIKASGNPDLALIVSDNDASVAGTFTTNRAAAAPVLVSKELAASGTARGVVVNSGCANACTGKQGYADAVEMAEQAAGALGAAPGSILVCSTGLIGSFLPMDKVRAGIAAAAADLSGDDEAAMKAIMTTDTKPKRSAVEHADGWRLGGICKGAGMIAPNMATMLAFITTDAVVDSRSLQSALSEIVEVTFNSVTIDGDRSTNDTVLAFANGASGVESSIEDLVTAMHMVGRSLAEQIVADGEGATKFVRVRVRGAVHDEDARAAARSIAESSLVKTALYGNDPNWGRIAAAIGNAAVEFEFEKLTISLNGVDLLSEGTPAAPETLRRLRGLLVHEPEVTIVCDLFLGTGIAEILTTDLSPEYVTLNAHYET